MYSNPRPKFDHKRPTPPNIGITVKGDIEILMTRDQARQLLTIMNNFVCMCDQWGSDDDTTQATHVDVAFVRRATELLRKELS